MKKTICFLLALLALLPCFLVVVSAEEKTASVLTELQNLQIDGQPFDESQYPINTADKNLYVLAAVEQGFRATTSSPEYGLLFYIYNPSGYDFVDYGINRVKIGFSDQCLEYQMLGVQLLSKSPDARFMKLAVRSTEQYGDMSVCYTKQARPAQRVYDVVSFELLYGQNLEKFEIDLAFFFEGFDYDNSLQSFSQELGALDVKLHTTNWISPNAGYRVDGESTSIYDHYEINSVYFMVPKSYFEDYGKIRSIKAQITQKFLTPIILTKSGLIDNETKNAILKQTNILADENVPEIKGFWAQFNYLDTPFLYYGEQWGYTNVNENFIAYDFPALSYYFENLPEEFNLEEPNIAKAVVRSAELREYFLERYLSSAYSKNFLYTQEESYPISFNSSEFDNTAFWDMETFGSALEAVGGLKEWWIKKTTAEDSYSFDDFETEAKYIEVLTNPSLYSTVEKAAVAADKLFIAGADAKDFADVCKKAAAQDCYVVLLRFGFSDYRCYPIYEIVMKTIALGSPGASATYATKGKAVGLAVEKWIYTDVSLCHIVFNKDGSDYVVPTASNVVDSYGNLDGFGNVATLPGEDLWAKFLKMLEQLWEAFKVILIVLAVLALLPIGLFVFQLVKGVVGGGVKLTQTFLKRNKKPPDENKKE